SYSQFRELYKFLIVLIWEWNLLLSNHWLLQTHTVFFDHIASNRNERMNYQNLYPDATPYQSAPQYTFPPQPSQATDTRPLIPQYPKPRRSMFSKFCILCCGLVCLCLIVVIVIPAVF